MPSRASAEHQATIARISNTVYRRYRRHAARRGSTTFLIGEEARRALAASHFPSICRSQGAMEMPQYHAMARRSAGRRLSTGRHHQHHSPALLSFLASFRRHYRATSRYFSIFFVVDLSRISVRRPACGHSQDDAPKATILDAGLTPLRRGPLRGFRRRPLPSSLARHAQATAHADRSR